MMKKLLSVFLAFAMIAALLCGCGLFAEETDDNGGKSDGNSRDPIKVTDSYTYKDPTDLDFDVRYVIYCDENSEAVAFMADEGMRAIYIVIYGKDGKPVRHHTIEVYDTAENTQVATDTYNGYGYGAVIADEDPTVLYYLQEGDELEATILGYIGYGEMKDDSIESYVESMHESWGGVLQ